MVSTTVNEETGEEKKRLINKMRWKGYGPISIPFTERQVRPTFAMRSCHFSSVCEGPGQACAKHPRRADSSQRYSLQ
jgi:hypothetical protein